MAIFISFFLVMSAFSSEKDLEKDITFLSFERSFLDSDYRGTLSIKNNTDEKITEIVFWIIYVDKSGNQVDYGEFTKDVNIDPGMVKRIEINGFDGDKYYGGDDFSDSTKFHTEFKLKDYKTEKKRERLHFSRIFSFFVF